VPVELVLAPIKPRVPPPKKTDLEEIKEEEKMMSGVRCYGAILNAVQEVITHCPRMYQLLLTGTPGEDHDVRLFYPVSNVQCVDFLMRYWRFDDFYLDNRLGQAFNYDVTVLEEAKRRNFVNIIRLDSMFFSKYAFCMRLKRYQCNLREYLDKYRKHHELNEILLQVLAGLKELRSMGFVHHDIKPENIYVDCGRTVRAVIANF
jgi:serine/threonine protein kinase